MWVLVLVRFFGRKCPPRNQDFPVHHIKIKTNRFFQRKTPKSSWSIVLQRTKTLDRNSSSSSLLRSSNFSSSSSASSTESIVPFFIKGVHHHQHHQKTCEFTSKSDVNKKPRNKKIILNCSSSSSDMGHHLSEEMSLRMPVNPTMMGQGDASSSSGEDVDISNGRNKRRSAATSSPGRRKRNRKGPSDAIVEAMLEIAAASRLRAAAMTKNDDKFSISNCIKVLDEIHGLDQHLYFVALDLFENSNARETFISLRNDRRLTWLQGKCGVNSMA